MVRVSQNSGPIMKTWWIFATTRTLRYFSFCVPGFGGGPLSSVYRALTTEMKAEWKSISVTWSPTNHPFVGTSWKNLTNPGPGQAVNWNLPDSQSCQVGKNKSLRVSKLKTLLARRCLKIWSVLSLNVPTSRKPKSKKTSVESNNKQQPPGLMTRTKRRWSAVRSFWCRLRATMRWPWWLPGYPPLSALRSSPLQRSMFSRRDSSLFPFVPPRSQVNL